MNDINTVNYIGPNDLVYTNDKKNNIHAGGFSVNSILMKSGISPIMTLNGQSGGGSKVSDLFKDLVVPNWALSYNGYGGGVIKNNNNVMDNEIIEDNLHDQLLKIVQEQPQKTHTKNKTKKNQKTQSKKTKTRSIKQ